MAIELNEFQLINSTLEFRYPEHFLFWDRSGKFWQRLSEKFTSLSVKMADPNKVSVAIDSHSEASAGIKSAHVTSANPGPNCEKLRDVASFFLPALIDQLKLEYFSRIGMRLKFERSFPTREGAAEYVRSNATLPHLSGRLMNVEGCLLDPEVAMRWESEKNGFHARIMARQVRLDFNLPVEFRQLEPEPNERLRNQVLIDVDYYVHSTTLADQIKADDLVESWTRIIRRDLVKVFNVTA